MRVRCAAAIVAALGVLAVTMAGCGRPAAPGSAPGSAWQVAYDGYGRVGGAGAGGARGGAGAAGTRPITLIPARPSSAGSTHAALVLSLRRWRDFAFDVRVRTNSQLRRGRANDWEVGWVVWHYLGNQHFYYIMLRADGWELGQESPGYPGHQRFLATGTRPAFPLRRWYQVRISQRGDVISVRVDGRPLVRFADTVHPYLSGRVGLYAEDASASYRPLGLTSFR